MSEGSEESGAGRRGGDALYELRRALDRVAVVSEGVRVDVAAAERARRRESRLTLLAAAAVTLMSAILIVIGWQNHSIAEQNRRISQQIVDCTTAGGVCYEQGQRRTGDAIAELVRADLAVAACARDPKVPTAGLEACVAERLAR